MFKTFYWYMLLLLLIKDLKSKDYIENLEEIVMSIVVLEMPEQKVTGMLTMMKKIMVRIQ